MIICKSYDDVPFPIISTPSVVGHSNPEIETGVIGYCAVKGAGVFERPGQTMDQLCIFGTSRTSNGLKSGP